MIQNEDRIGAWLRVLKYIKAHPNESQIADMSEFFDVTHTSMIHVVNSLEEKGYVFRQPIRRSRGKKILLTDRGRQLADENESRIDLIEKAMMDGFSESDKHLLLNMLKRINDNIDQHFNE